MLILTANQYLKTGIEKLTEQVPYTFTGELVIFDAGDEIYVLQDGRTPDGALNLFSILTSGKRIRKNDIKTPQHFYKYFLESQCNSSSPEIRNRPGRLTVCEETIIWALCHGYTTTEIAAKLDKSVKTVSCQKSTALRKLGMRNMQCLYRMFIYWSVALENTRTFPCEQAPNIWTKKMSVSSQCIL
jgi:DNA-binding CsgD family transcriptional regulator